MSLTEQIRAAYPNPVKSHSRDFDTDYCVGGACDLFKGGTARMPYASGLQRVFNEQYGKDATYEQCVNIIQANDKGNFEQAWTLVKEILG